MAEQDKNDDLGKLVKNTKKEEYEEIKKGEKVTERERYRMDCGNCSKMFLLSIIIVISNSNSQCLTSNHENHESHVDRTAVYIYRV